MNKIHIKNLHILSALMIAAGAMLTSCSKDQEFTEPGSENFLITAIKVDVSSTLPVAVGMDSTLVYSVLPENPTNPELLWTSSDEKVATVSQTGTVTGVSTGEATITVAPAIGFGGNGAVQTITVKVVPEVIKATSIEFTNKETEIYETDKLQLKYSLLPANHTYEYLTWTSNDESVAKVTENGVVEGIKAGEVTITAHTHDKSGVNGTYNLKVLPYIPVEKVIIEPLDGAICVTKPIQLSFTYSPEGATAGSVDWISSDEKVIKVEQGLLTPVGFGSAVITATCKTNGSQATTSVTVTDGWYVWDASNSFNGWTVNTGGATASISGEKMTVTMKKGNTWRGDIIYKGSPNQFGRGYGIVAIKGTLPSAGARKWDAVCTAGNSGGPNQTGTLKAKNGTPVYYYNMTAKFADMATQLLSYSIFQFKMADFPLDSCDGTYDIYWIRTFTSLTELEDFIANE